MNTSQLEKGIPGEMKMDLMGAGDNKIKITNVIPELGATYVTINDVAMTPEDAINLGEQIRKAGERGRVLNNLLVLLVETMDGAPTPIIKAMLSRLG